MPVFNMLFPDLLRKISATYLHFKNPSFDPSQTEVLCGYKDQLPFLPDNQTENHLAMGLL